jgi:enamine deaminase RidA (YjgF/YER057c/UK114 family)
MEREPINPTSWGLKWSMNQAEITKGASRQLRCSGQVPVSPDPDSELGFAVESPDNIRGQIECTLSNLDKILVEAGMGRENVVYMRFYTTDVDEFLTNYDIYADWIGQTGLKPPQTLLGVQRLALPEFMVEIEALAEA